MKIKLILFYYLLFFSMQIFPISDQEKFMQAQNFYADAKYELALHAYQSVEVKGFAALFNIALCYAHQGNLLQAMVYAQRAQRHGNFRQLGQVNAFYDCIHRQIDPEFSLTTYEQLAIFCKKCILSIPMVLLQILFLMLLSLIIILSFLGWRVVSQSIMLSIIFVTMLVGACWKVKDSMHNKRTGVVKHNVIPVFAGPDASFYKKSQLHFLQDVCIIAQQQEYYQIKTAQSIGWIHNNDVEQV